VTEQEWMMSALQDMIERRAARELGFDKTATEILAERNALLKSCVAGQTIMTITHTIAKDVSIIGVYVKHDEKGITVTKDGKERQVAFLDMERMKKL
ncbi:MAG: hypothetical protein ACYC3I_26845, partial [Gemmataceae bacterium]